MFFFQFCDIAKIVNPVIFLGDNFLWFLLFFFFFWEKKFQCKFDYFFPPNYQYHKIEENTHTHTHIYTPHYIDRP
jgi:predicted PurR-regulated permease PerM